MHLNNDFSGSPKILADAIRVVVERDWKCKLYVSSSSSNGFLSNPGCKVEKYWFRRYPRYRIFTFLALLISQILLFLKLVRDDESRAADFIYVNTLLPFGALLFGWIFKKRTICHVHELSLSPKILQKSLEKLIELSGATSIFVSAEQQKLSKLRSQRSFVVPNSLPDSFLYERNKAKDRLRSRVGFGVLMICSTARYKGLDELIQLANEVGCGTDAINFTCVLNCSSSELIRIESEKQIPPNLKLEPVTSTPGLYYEKAKVILNLSRVDMWIETFGLTVLEGMAYGLVPIAPPVGGTRDFLIHGENGFMVDSRNTRDIALILYKLAEDFQLWHECSKRAQETADRYTETRFGKNIINVLEEEICH